MTAAARPDRRLEVVDDPLAVGTAASATPEARERADHVPDVKPSTDATPPRDRTRRGPRPQRRRRTPASEVDGADRPRDLWEPPALDEQLALLAARVPHSLERALERHAAQLREEEGGSSQKRLPKQDVLAALLWAAGDPDDPQARERLRQLYREYRRRRLAAAARGLEV